jgi:hypothetical protein
MPGNIGPMTYVALTSLELGVEHGYMHVIHGNIADPLIGDV